MSTRIDGRVWWGAVKLRSAAERIPSVTRRHAGEQASIDYPATQADNRHTHAHTVQNTARLTRVESDRHKGGMQQRAAKAKSR
jgi:hypothetical protein